LKRREIKKEILLQLDQYSPEQLKVTLSEFPRVPLINSLFMALCDPNEQIKWHAVSSFGHIVSTMAEENPESARIIMRRFLWSLNDESGGIGWGAPESMSQIMCENELLRHEYLHMLISYMREDGDELFQDGNYLELPLLQRGLLWGAGTLCMYHPGEMNAYGVSEDLIHYLDSADSEVRHLALWALFHLGQCYSLDDLVLPELTASQIRVYMRGEMRDVNLNSIYERLISRKA